MAHLSGEAASGAMGGEQRSTLVWTSPVMGGVVAESLGGVEFGGFEDVMDMAVPGANVDTASLYGSNLSASELVDAGMHLIGGGRTAVVSGDGYWNDFGNGSRRIGTAGPTGDQW